MSDSVFLDTNLLIYYVSDDIPKKKRVHDLMTTALSITVSSQVINEFEFARTFYCVMIRLK